MPLRIVEPIADIRRALVDELSLRARATAFRTERLRAARPAALGLAAPHPVFHLGLDEVGRPGCLERVAMTGWRYFVTEGDAVVAAAEALASSPHGPLLGTQTNEGPFVAGSVAALSRAESLPQVDAGHYALGLLRVPALYVVALWLRDEQPPGAHDLFVPVEPAPAPLQVGVAITAEAFEQALVEVKAAKAEGGDERTN